MEGQICKIWREMKSVTAMVVVQIAGAGLNILFKLSMEDGMNPSVLVAYRLFFATLLMLPLSFIFQRKKRPEFTWVLLLQALLSGSLGVVIPSILTITGLALTSATFTSAAAVLTPMTTFVLAAICRMESVRLGSNEGKAKVFGTLLGVGGRIMLDPGAVAPLPYPLGPGLVGGALVFIFYKGKNIHLWSTHVDFVKQRQPRDSSRDHTTTTHHHISIFGALLVFGGNFSYSIWLLLQVKISKRSGGPYWNATLMNMMGSLVAGLIALCGNRDLKKWRLGWNIRLLTIAYAAIVISGMVIAVNAWCLESRGPLFVSIFSPIGLVIVAFVGSFVLDETLHMGSIIGTVIIVGGLYFVLWGKNKEMKRITTITTNTTLDQIVTNKTNKDITLNNLPTLSTN